MKFRVMKLIDLFGLIKMSATNSFLSMTSPVLLVASATTLKSVYLVYLEYLVKKGSTKFLNCALVNSSLNSKSWNLDAVAIAFSSSKNSRLTFIRSNALGFVNAVLSPKSVTPCPEKFTTGFTLARYNLSLSALLGL